MRFTLLVVGLMLLTGCKQQPPRQPKFSDAYIADMHRRMPGMTDECLQKLKWGGSEALPPKEEDCFKFTQPQRMRGLWRNDFEGSLYCDGSVRKCPDGTENANSYVWLEMRSQPPGVEDAPGGLYAIDFVGKRSVGAGLFGHMGLAKNEVIVDRLISIKEIEAPLQLTDAQLKALKKGCEESSGCPTPGVKQTLAPTKN